jgi:hypothetical protein
MNQGGEYMKTFLHSDWPEIVKFYQIWAEGDEKSKKIIEFAKVTSIEKNITIEDALFIILYGNANIYDKEFYRSLN